MKDRKDFLETVYVDFCKDICLFMATYGLINFRSSERVAHNLWLYTTRSEDHAQIQKQQIILP